MNLIWIAPIALFLGCQSLSQAPRPSNTLEGFAWTHGTWKGTRVDEGDGSTASMVLQVSPILAGAGTLEELEVTHSGGVYRGLHVRLYEPESERWVSHYANAVHGRMVPLEGRQDGERWIWRSTSPTRRRESRLLDERPGEGRWRRTQEVSEDDGESWRILFTDELVRVAD